MFEHPVIAIEVVAFEPDGLQWASPPQGNLLEKLNRSVGIGWRFNHI